MSSNPAARTTQSTSQPLLHLEAARRVAPLIRENAEKIEADRELPRPVFEALADAGLFHMVVPRGIGGAELPLTEYVQVLEEIGKADASTGWAVNQGGTFGSFAARMKPDVARAIWIDTPRSVVANTPGPTSKAVPVPGGYRVSGRGPFSTGCKHSSWIAANGQIVESLYTACGATVVFDGHLIQRLFQDMHVITQHGQGRLQHYEIVGQHRLGVEIDDSRL